MMITPTKIQLLVSIFFVTIKLGTDSIAVQCSASIPGWKFEEQLS